MASSSQQQPHSSSKQQHESSLKPTRPPKTLILCFDGTSNSFSDENTNVVRLFNALEKHKSERQMCYYQPGIGTYLAPTTGWIPALQKIAKVMDMGFAWYLDWHIMGGYKFLMENYSDGDQICLFGFSRGAYTARCLAGMLHKVGLLPKSNEEQISFAYKKYKDTTPNGKANAKGFKSTFSRNVEIEFLGVWDTVGSVGFFSRHLPFTASNTIVRNFRHALALDEHRAKFRPNPWHRAAPSAAAARFDPDRGTPVVRIKSGGPAANIIEKITDKIGDVKQGAKKVGQVVEGVVGDVVEGKIAKRKGYGVWNKRSVNSVDSEAIDPAARVVDASGSQSDEEYYYGNYHGSRETDVKEVWFAGCHADVGGGSAHNNKTNTLANPSLVWMVNEIISAGAPIVFKKGAFEDMPAFDALMIKLPRERVSDPIPATATATPHTVVEGEPSPASAPAQQLDLATPNAGSDTPTRTPPPIRRDAFMTHTILEKPKVMRPSSTTEGDLTSASAPTSAEPDPNTHASKLPRVSIPSTAPPDVIVQSPAPLTPPRPGSPQPPGTALPTAATTMSMTEWSPGSDHLTVVQVFEDNPKKDANAPMFDQLQRKKIWWVLELIPLWQYHQDKEGSWHKGFYWNRGRPREIQDPNPLFHSSVKLRKNYEPRANLQPGAKVTYVD
ncbi:hypothetical protein FRC04_002094 [Tulasnella sp. 424]|nr:hypothetical protein FRC04_002094 [Tulasnella sp. 424]KAG8967992.1 hypothetical protein FRC05_001702 [Tulasnella sp. 425]